jgi:Tfp pilus assembly protein PilF
VAHLAASVASGAERSWVEVKSPNFRVVSNAGEKEARRVAWQFEQVRAAFQAIWPWARVPTAEPIVVVAAKDETTMKSLVPEYWERKGGVRPASVFVSGADKHYIGLRTDLPGSDREGVNPYRMAYWPYVGLILQSSFDRDPPLWLSRGLAEVFSNTIVREKDIEVGRLIPWHLERLRGNARMSIADLLAVDRRSPYYTQEDRRDLFDAQAWALVHYLEFGDEGRHRPQLDRLVQLLRSGREPGAALAEAFGDAAAFTMGLANYITKQVYQYARMNVDVNVDSRSFTFRELPVGEAAAVQAGLHAAMRRPAEARAMLDQARQAAPTLAAVWEVEAALAEAEMNTDRAREAYGKAVDLGSTSYRAHYRYAQFLWRSDADDETFRRIEKALEQAVELNHDYAAAYSFLADVKARLGRAEQGLGLARRAVSLEPGTAYHRIALARVLWATGNREEALREARASLAAARDDRDRREATEMLAFLEKAATPRP